MCGIAGCVKFGGASASDLSTSVRQMTQSLVHRGPDDEGHWIDGACGVALGFRRLAIIDVSAAGHQPMISCSGRYVIVFNGEVYNFEELRSELLQHNHAFRGHSDTEVILAAIEQWGVESAVRRFVGMFAIALWDRESRTLFLIRDRLGIKPVYYSANGGTFLFGSELKALRAFPGFDPMVDRTSLTLFLRYCYVPQPRSIYQGVSKLPPGTILSVSTAGETEIKPYWSAQDVFERGAAAPFQGDDGEAVDQLHALLSKAVGMRMVADVPLGAFLSGGIDSSTVVALMQSQSSRPIKTFSIGFAEESFNEAHHAKNVAAHLGTDHTELYVTPEEAMAVLPKIPVLYDEPFSDSSQIPTYLVSQLARRYVTVSLSGDGGDELFGGYTRYAQGYNVWRSTRIGPRPVRRSVAWVLSVLSDSALNAVLAAAMRVLPPRWRFNSPAAKARKFQRITAADTPGEYYQTIVSRSLTPERLLQSGQEPLTALTDSSCWPRVQGVMEWMMAMDLITYLPDDILTKVDRASMAVSLEARVPLIDHRVVEFAASLPLELKVRKHTTKWILREVLYRHVPPEIVERPKMGFGIPVARWIRGPLRDWAEELLSESRLRDEGFFDVATIRHAWSEHLKSGLDNEAPLWDVLMFQAWLQHWKRSGSVAASSAYAEAVRRPC